MPWTDDFLGWVDDFQKKHGQYPEDFVLQWIAANPRSAVAVLFGIVSGVPLVIGFGLGALFF